MGPGASPLSYLIPIGVAAVVILLRNSRPRRLRVESLWILPTIYILLLASSLAAAPPPVTPESVGLLVLGFALGAAFGWQRGRFTKIDIDPQTHELSARQSAIGLVFIFAILAVRFGARDLLAANASTLHIPIAAALDAFFALAIAMLSVQRLEVWLRASKMLAVAKAEKGGGAPPPIVS
jgi:hypothetical protein